jgi:hypothetical protein
MKPNEGLGRYYDINAISSEAVKAKESIEVTNRLDKLFESDSTTIAVTQELSYVPTTLNALVNGFLSAKSLTAEISKPYDHDDSQGIELVTRIIKLNIGGPLDTTSDKAKIYLVGYMGAEQTNLTSNNFRFGVALLEDGQRAFFEYYKAEDKPSNTSGSFHAKELEPDVQYTLVEEFKKAQRSLLDLDN